MSSGVVKIKRKSQFRNYASTSAADSLGNGRNDRERHGADIFGLLLGPARPGPDRPRDQAVRTATVRHHELSGARRFGRVETNALTREYSISFIRDTATRDDAGRRLRP